MADTSIPDFVPESPISGGIGADAPFWSALNAGEFRLPACAGCGAWQWPADFRCGDCGTWGLDWRRVEPRGTIYSWTTTHMAFPRVQARRDEVPYTTALVEIDGVGARVFGVLDGVPPAMGTAVRGEIHPPTDQSLGYPSLHWVADGGDAQ